MTLIALAALTATIARAEAPKIPFAQDPLCAEPPAHFQSLLDKARPLHVKFPQFRAVLGDQNKWFSAVTGEMKSVCEADAKFAAELLRKDRSALTGQCKPAAEAALADQEVLEHSEASLKRLQGKREEFLLKPVKGGPDSLWNIFERDHKRVDVDALDLLDVPRPAACELQWMYPQAFLKKKVPFVGCPEAPPGVKLSDGDKKDAGVFAQLMTRFAQSIEYNTQRRNNALATATASRARYEACVAQNPGTENVLKAAKGTGGAGSAKPVPKGKAPAKGASDITGIEEDRAKQKK